MRRVLFHIINWKPFFETIFNSKEMKEYSSNPNLPFTLLPTLRFRFEGSFTFKIDFLGLFCASFLCRKSDGKVAKKSLENIL